MSPYRNTRSGNFIDRRLPQGTYDRIMQALETDNPFRDRTRELYAVELKEDENTGEASNFSSPLARKEAFQCRCMEFIKNAFKERNDAGLFVSMTDKGCCEFCCFLTEEEVKTLQGKDEVKSTSLVPNIRKAVLPEPVVAKPKVPDDEGSQSMARFCAFLKEKREAAAAAGTAASASGGGPEYAYDCLMEFYNREQSRE